MPGKAKSPITAFRLRIAPPGMLLCVALAALATAGPAAGDVTVFSSLGDCEFDLDYGAAPGAALVLGALHVDGVGTVNNPYIEADTGLTLDCFLTGEGTSAVQITTQLTNTTGSAVSGLRFFQFVDPDGNSADTDAPGVDWSGAGDPDFYSIDDYWNLDTETPGNLDYDVFVLAQLGNDNRCPPVCDVTMAVQYDIGVLKHNEVVQFTTQFSDAGLVLDERFLTASAADSNGVPNDPNTILTVSGESTSPFPVPAISPSGLVLLTGLILAAAVLRLRARPRFAWGIGQTSQRLSRQSSGEWQEPRSDRIT